MKKLQQGRSMIEMLGVLAIIGVLSIGGLAGYTMAMNRHKANQILDYISRCGVLVETAGESATLTNCAALMDGETAPSGFAATVSRTNGVATLNVTTWSDSDAVTKAVKDRFGTTTGSKPYVSGDNTIVFDAKS